MGVGLPCSVVNSRVLESAPMYWKTHFLLLGLLFAADLPAATIVVDPNPIVTANSIVNSVTGADMAGLLVTARYGSVSGPIVVAMIWQATGPTSGAASASVFAQPGVSAVSVSLSGDASGSLAWQYQSIILGPLLSLEFDGTAAGVYFDRAHSNPGTPGSGPGADITFGPLHPNGIDASFVVTYSSAVALDGSSPQDDLYAKLRIDFPNGVPGPVHFFPQDFAFTQDTDRNVVPEPASFLLLGSGLAVIGTCLQRCRARG